MSFLKLLNEVYGLIQCTMSKDIKYRLEENYNNTCISDLTENIHHLLSSDTDVPEDLLDLLFSNLNNFLFCPEIWIRILEFYIVDWGDKLYYE